MHLYKCDHCSSEFHGSFCPSCSSKDFKRIEVPKSDSWITSVGIVFAIVITIVCFFAFVWNRETSSSASGAMSQQRVETPRKKKESYQASPEESERLNRAMAKGREKLQIAFNALNIRPTDLKVTDTAYFDENGITVNLGIDIFSDAFREQIASKKLRTEIYPTITSTFKAELWNEGFTKVNIRTFTNPFKKNP